MNKEPLTKSLVNDWKVARAASGKYEDMITERIDFILRRLFITFGMELDYWYFDGAGEGEVGDLGRWMGDTEIHGIVTEVTRRSSRADIVILLKDGFEWGYDGSLPTRWLFEDFEQEVLSGKEKFEQQEIERKKKKAATKADDLALAEAAKAKLSKKELAALRRTL